MPDMTRTLRLMSDTSTLVAGAALYVNIKAQLSTLWDTILRNSQKQYKIILLPNLNSLD